MAIKTKVTTASSSKAYIAAYHKNAARLVAIVANDTRTAAVDSINEGTPSGEVYRRAESEINKGRAAVHRASAPGEPPAKDTGTLANQIAIEIGPTKRTAVVESRAEYSADLEHGTVHIEPRPFMQPAANVARAMAKAKGRSIMRARNVRSRARRRPV